MINTKPIFACAFALALSFSATAFAQNNTSTYEQARAEAEKNLAVNFNGIWQTAAYELVVRPPEIPNPPFTEQARKWTDDFKNNFDPVKDQPAMVCRVKGMPWTMLSRARDYTLEIVQTNTDISIFFEGDDIWRHIRIGQTEFPANIAPSYNGYSIAHWEGETLVVETKGMGAHPYPDPFLRSENAYIVERITRSTHPEHGDVIIIDMTITDPEIYTEPVHGHQVLKRSPAGTVVNGYGCQDALWRDYIEPKVQALENNPNNATPPH